MEGESIFLIYNFSTSILLFIEAITILSLKVLGRIPFTKKSKCLQILVAIL